MIYLDNSTATRPSLQVASKIIPYFRDRWFDPAAPYAEDPRAAKEAVKVLYQFLQADEKAYLAVTGSGAEAVNAVIQSVYYHTTLTTGKNHYLTTRMEEAPSILSIGKLEENGCYATLLTPDSEGKIHTKAIIEGLTPRTALLSMSLVNGLTGVVQPIQELLPLLKERGVLLHLDLSHALGKLEIDFSTLGADFVTFNGNLFHGPQQSGAICVAPGIPFSPLVMGEPPLAHLAALVGMGVAATEATASRDYVCTEIARLRSRLETEIEGIRPLFRDQERAPHITALEFPGVSHEALLYDLSRRELYACMGGGTQQQIGFVLHACGIQGARAESALSFSLSRDTTEEEIERAIVIISACYQRLRKISAYLVETP